MLFNLLKFFKLCIYFFNGLQGDSDFRLSQMKALKQYVSAVRFIKLYFTKSYLEFVRSWDEKVA